MGNTVGFNNFKAFGPQMQYFSKKPITLIYGPNSIGKSSLLHSQIYLDYYKQFDKDSNLYSSNFAGDKLDLGGIKNFIYQHDINSSINYEYGYSEKEDILNILNINDKNLRELFIDQKINFDYTLSAIQKKLEMDFEDTGIKFKYLLQLRASEYQFKRNVVFVDSLSTKEKILANFSKERDVFFAEVHSSLDEKIYKNIDELKNIFTNIYKTMDEKIDVFEKLLLATYESDPIYIFNTLKFFQYVFTISKINYTIKLFLINDEIKENVDFMINDNNVFKYNSIDKSFQVNHNHEIINLANNLNGHNEKYINDKDELSFYNFFHFSMATIVGTIFKTKQIQYYGPLRHYPKRWEMLHIAREKQSLQGEKHSSTFIKNILQYLIKIQDFFESQKFPIKIFRLPTKILFLIVFFISAIFSKNLRQEFGFNNDEFKDILNQVLPERLQLMREKKLKSNEIWKMLIHSSEVVDNLNLWLNNHEKFKSNYSITITEEKATVDELLIYKLHQFFGLEENFFDKREHFKNMKGYNLLDWIFYPMIKLVHFIFVKIEKILNLKSTIYAHEIEFTDLSNSTKVTPRDMGLGISQMLPILISTYANKNTNIYIEQPELHLHPSVQMELMDEFIKSHNSNKNSFILESHSEHMLLRVMKRIKQTTNGSIEDELLKLSPDDVCLLYVDNDGGQTYIQELRLSQSGKLLDHWPNGFFEEGFKERFM